MIELLNPARLARAKVTGALVADILHTIKHRTGAGTNLLDIDRWTQAMILEAGAQSCYVDYAPSFGRGPFGHYICTAVNDAVLHGLPHDYTLADGDLLTLDLAVVKDGVAADSAISFVVGESRPAGSVALIDATEQALAAGIAAARPGGRIGDISHPPEFADEEVAPGLGGGHRNGADAFTPQIGDVDRVAGDCHPARTRIVGTPLLNRIDVDAVELFALALHAGPTVVAALSDDVELVPGVLAVLG